MFHLVLRFPGDVSTGCKVAPGTPDPDVLGTSEHMFACQGAREHGGALCMLRRVPGPSAFTMPDRLCPDVFSDGGPSALAALMLTFTLSPYAFCLPPQLHFGATQKTYVL